METIDYHLYLHYRELVYKKGIVYFYIINLSEDRESMKLRVTEKSMRLY